MASERLRALLAAGIVAVAAVAGCGGSSEEDGGAAGARPEGTPTQQESPTPDAASAGEGCPDIPVPGHEATQVRVDGASCEQAAQLAAAAVGKGRQPYKAAGFTCEPSDAGSGDTSYVCAQGDGRVTFRYGAA